MAENMGSIPQEIDHIDQLTKIEEVLKRKTETTASRPRYTYHLTVIGIGSSGWTTQVEADDVDDSSTGYYYFSIEKNSRHTTIAYYPIAHTVIHKIIDNESTD